MFFNECPLGIICFKEDIFSSLLACQCKMFVAFLLKKKSACWFYWFIYAILLAS